MLHNTVPSNELDKLIDKAFYYKKKKDDWICILDGKFQLFPGVVWDRDTLRDRLNRYLYHNSSDYTLGACTQAISHFERIGRIKLINITQSEREEIPKLLPY